MRKQNSLFDYKGFHKDLYKEILKKNIRPKRKYFKAADMFIKIIGEKQIKNCYSKFYEDIDLGVIDDKIKVIIFIKDEPYILRCDYIFDRPVLIMISISYKNEYIANISGSIYSVKKYFKRIFNDIKKKMKDNKEPPKDTGLFYYLASKDHCALYDDGKYNYI